MSAIGPSRTLELRDLGLDISPAGEVATCGIFMPLSARGVQLHASLTHALRGSGLPRHVEDLGGLALASDAARSARPAPVLRVFAPTSEHLPPDLHYKLVARLNGIFDGIADPKSFTLSQSYFFGSVNNNPDHHAHWNPVGNFIDQMPELDARALGKDETRDQAGDNKKQAKRKPKGFQKMLVELARAPEGTRNDLLNRCAFEAGLKIAEGILNEDQARAALVDAAIKCGLTEREALGTIESGVPDGKRAFVVEPDGRKVVHMKPGELSKTQTRRNKFCSRLALKCINARANCAAQ